MSISKTMKSMLVTVSVFVLIGGNAWAAGSGTTNAPAATNDAGSAMWTLNDIYNVLNTRTTNVAQRTGGFTEPSAGPANGIMYTLNDIMLLVTNRAPVATTSFGTNWQMTANIATYTPVPGEDWYAIGGSNGVAWPVPRFTVYSGTATDNLTGLIWLTNANVAATATNWAAALSLVVELNTSGTMNGHSAGDTSNGGSHQTDWRLPNIRELLSLIDYGMKGPALPYGNPFKNTTAAASTGWWTSSTYESTAAGATAWAVAESTGITSSQTKTNNTYYVWPVRGGH